MSPLDDIGPTYAASVSTATEVSAARPDSATARPETIRLQPTSGFSRVLSPRELWRYRDLALQISMRDITVRYRQTALGAIWAVLQPVGFMVVFSLFFGQLAGVTSDGLPYALFSLTALVPWTFFSNALLLGSDSLVSNSALVSKVYFPRIFMPAGILVAGFVDLSISFVILVAIVLAWGFVPTVGVLLLPVLVAIAAAAALGISAALSAINVRYRDVRYIVPFAIQMWLLASPIAYPSSLLDEPWRTVSAINPMVGVVEGFRWAMLGTPDAPMAQIGLSAVSAALLLLAGLAYFDRVERRFADFV
jgi:lipopolysaccharide transport system permease protein